MKTKILIIAVLVLSIAMFSTGAYAYFSAQAVATQGTIESGTLSIKLASNDSSTIVPAVFSDTVTPPWNFAKIVPGKTVKGCLWVQNTGNVDSVGVRWDFKNLANSKTGINLEDRLQITELYTSDSLWSWPAALLPGGAWYAGGAYDQDSDGKISLGEMARWSDRFAPNNYDWVNDNDSKSFLTLAPGDKGFICMTLEMMNGTPAVDNPFQGDIFTYDVTVTANNPAIGPLVP